MAVAILDTATATATPDPNYTVSAGTDRCLIFAISQEGTVSQPTATYGGQSMTHVVGVESATGVVRVDFFYLNDTGITAATGNQVVVTGDNASNSTYHTASYSGVSQSTPTVTDTDHNVTATDLSLSVTSVTNGAVICVGSNSDIGNATWSGGVTERTDQDASDHSGSLADEIITTGAAETYGMTHVSKNRLAGVAVVVSPASAGTSIPVFMNHYSRMMRG